MEPYSGSLLNDNPKRLKSATSQVIFTGSSPFSSVSEPSVFQPAVNTMKQASVQFLKWTSLYEVEKPFQIFGDLLNESADQRKTNLTWEEKQIRVQDIRENTHSFQVDSHGFTVRHLPNFTELPDGEIISGEYIPAIKMMLKAELEDVGTVFVFDWRVRPIHPRVITHQARSTYNHDSDQRKQHGGEGRRQDQLR